MQITDTKDLFERYLHGSNHFKPEYCSLLIEKMSKGMSVAEFCTEIMCCKPTFYAWCNKYPEFRAAHGMGVTASEAYWLRYGLEHGSDPDFNNIYYQVMLGSRFGISSKTRKVEAQVRHR